MADKNDKNEFNVAGKFYVDTQCIDCGQCYTSYPNFFSHNDDNGCAYVSKQPSTPEESAECDEAKSSCPVEAIGDDGE